MIWLNGDFKDLKRRTASDKKIKHLILQKTLNMMDIKEDFILRFTSFLLKSPLRFRINLYQVGVLI